MCCFTFLKSFSSRHLLGFLALTCAAILGAAYVLKHVYGVQPCPMCLYEQDVFMAGGALSLLGFLIFPPTLRRWTLLLLGFVFFGGTLLAAYHVAIQQHWVSLPAFCAAQDFSAFDSVDALRDQLLNTPFVRCDQVTWSLFGFSLAAYNALISFVLMLLCWKWVCVNRSASCK